MRAMRTNKTKRKGKPRTLVNVRLVIGAQDPDAELGRVIAEQAHKEDRAVTAQVRAMLRQAAGITR